MAKSFKSLNDATEAVFLYLENKMSVHDITSKFEVNTFRLYEAVDGIAWHGAKKAALKKLHDCNPTQFSMLPLSGKLRRGSFCSSPPAPLPLFG